MSSSSQHYRLPDGEIMQLHERATKFVETHLRNSDCPNMTLASYASAANKMARTHFISPFEDAHTVVFGKQELDALDKCIPGATIRSEKDHRTGQVCYQMEIPILFPKRGGKNGGGGGGGASKHEALIVAPTLEWIAFLAAVETILCGVMYYRVYVAGVMF
jgi:hypothetical protein